MFPRKDSRISIKLLDDKGKEKYRDQIVSMLNCYSDEFVPPLTKRDSTVQKDFNCPDEGETVERYAESLLSQEVLVATIKGYSEEIVVGLAGFIRNFEVVPPRKLGGLYVTTILMDKAYRGLGVARRFYDKIFKEADKTASFTLVRTWTGNNIHIGLLEKIGFREVRRLKDDRGEGIDSIIFSRPPEINESNYGQNGILI